MCPYTSSATDTTRHVLESDFIAGPGELNVFQSSQTHLAVVEQHDRLGMQATVQEH